MAPGSRRPRRHRRNANEPGHAHELTFSCYRRYPFLSRDRICQWLVESIERARKSLEFDVWAWVFMPDHVHLVVHPRRPAYDVAAIRRQIKEPVARQALAWLRPGGQAENLENCRVPSVEISRRCRDWTSGRAPGSVAERDLQLRSQSQTTQVERTI